MLLTPPERVDSLLGMRIVVSELVEIGRSERRSAETEQWREDDHDRGGPQGEDG